MKFLATVDADRRGDERQPVIVGTKIEGEGFGTRVVLVDDLSVSGFAMVAALPLPRGAQIAINLPRVGERSASVIWQEGLRVGCAFAEPLSSDDIEQIAAADTEVAELREKRAATGWRPRSAAVTA